MVIPFAPYGSAIIAWTQKTLHPQRPASKAVTEADLCVIASITRQAQRAKDVLNRVRSYAKGKSDRSQSVNLASLNNPRLKARVV